jgi:hypothetical protein
MQETKVTLIYFGLSLFIFLALIPWIVGMDLAVISIQVLAIFGGVVVAFLGGLIWGWDDQFITPSNLWYAIGFSLLGFGVILLSRNFLPYSLILLIISLQAYLYFEISNSDYYKNNIKYSQARKLITNLVTICCITSLAFIYNPYT